MMLENGNVLQIMSCDKEILDIRVWNNDGCTVLKECPIYLNDNVTMKQILIDDENQVYSVNALNDYLRSAESLLRL